MLPGRPVFWYRKLEGELMILEVCYDSMAESSLHEFFSLTRREVSRGGNIVFIILNSAEVFLYLAQVYAKHTIICPELALFHRFFELTTTSYM